MAIADCAAGGCGTPPSPKARQWAARTKDPLHLTFAGVKAGTYVPGNGCPDGIHYDVKGNLWAAMAGLGGIIQIDPRGIILGFVRVPNGDLATTNFALAARTTSTST
jgi:sugar lactone lactonase YvrE